MYIYKEEKKSCCGRYDKKIWKICLLLNVFNVFNILTQNKVKEKGEHTHDKIRRPSFNDRCVSTRPVTTIYIYIYIHIYIHTETETETRETQTHKERDIIM